MSAAQHSRPVPLRTDHARLVVEQRISLPDPETQDDETVFLRDLVDEYYRSAPPDPHNAGALHRWLREPDQASRYVIHWEPEGPRLNFVATVVQRNGSAYDAIAAKFD